MVGERNWRAVVAATVVVAAAYLGWAGWYVAGESRSLIGLANVGSVFLARSDTSPRIDRLTPHRGSPAGYDGQFFLFVALDPVGARPYLDEPSYRYGRILYPLLARAAALDRSSRMPATLLLVNIAALIAATAALARFLQRRGTSPWFALLFGLYPGVFLATTRDLSEPLAYSLVALALLALDRPGRRGLVTGAVLLALAALTRETTLLFAVAAAWGVARGELGGRPGRGRGAAVLAGAIAPYLVLKAALAVWLGSVGSGTQTHFSVLPFGGFLADWPPGLRSFEQFYAVVAPSLVFLVVALVATRRATAGIVALVLNVIVLVVMLPAASYVEYVASGRIVVGVVLAALVCLPVVRKAGHADLAWVAFALWLSPWYWLLPQLFER